MLSLIAAYHKRLALAVKVTFIKNAHFLSLFFLPYPFLHINIIIVLIILIIIIVIIIINYNKNCQAEIIL